MYASRSRTASIYGCAVAVAALALFASPRVALADDAGGGCKMVCAKSDCIVYSDGTFTCQMSDCTFTCAAT
jgi:hypothetical protein